MGWRYSNASRRRQARIYNQRLVFVETSYYGSDFMISSLLEACSLHCSPLLMIDFDAPRTSMRPKVPAWACEDSQHASPTPLQIVDLAAGGRLTLGGTRHSSVG